MHDTAVITYKYQLCTSRYCGVFRPSWCTIVYFEVALVEPSLFYLQSKDSPNIFSVVLNEETKTYHCGRNIAKTTTSCATVAGFAYLCVIKAGTAFGSCSTERFRQDSKISVMALDKALNVVSARIFATARCDPFCCLFRP